MSFNVVIFGSQHELLWPGGCKPYGGAAEAEALAWIQARVSADLGGTEIHAVMEAVYAARGGGGAGARGGSRGHVG